LIRALAFKASALFYFSSLLLQNMLPLVVLAHDPQIATIIYGLFSSFLSLQIRSNRHPPALDLDHSMNKALNPSSFFAH
jgi:hypothetical protein